MACRCWSPGKAFPLKEFRIISVSLLLNYTPKASFQGRRGQNLRAVLFNVQTAGSASLLQQSNPRTQTPGNEDAPLGCSTSASRIPPRSAPLGSTASRERALSAAAPAATALEAGGGRVRYLLRNLATSSFTHGNEGLRHSVWPCFVVALRGERSQAGSGERGSRTGTTHMTSGTAQ